MTRTFLACIASLTLVAWAAPDTASTKGGVEESLMQLEKDWAQAIVKGDAGFFERIEASTFVFTAPDGKVSDKTQDVKDVKSGNLKASGVDVGDMKVQVYGDAAVVTGRTIIKGGHYGGEDISGEYRFTDVFVKQQGQWRAVASQSTKVMK